MFTLKVNRTTYTNVVGFEFMPRHGFSEIKHNLGGSVIYEGFYNDEYFRIESVHDYGVTSWEVLHGNFTEEKEEELISWIEKDKHENDKVFQEYIKRIQ